MGEGVAKAAPFFLPDFLCLWYNKERCFVREMGGFC